MQTTILLSCLLLAAIESAWPTPADRSLSSGPGKCEHVRSHNHKHDKHLLSYGAATSQKGMVGSMVQQSQSQI